MPGNYRFISAEQKRLVLIMSLLEMMVRDIVSATNEVEDGGAIRTESRGLASPAPASFLKRLFVQSEAESRNFREVPGVLHLAVTILGNFAPRCRGSGFFITI